MGTEETERAIQAAKRALPEWSQKTAKVWTTFLKLESTQALDNLTYFFFLGLRSSRKEVPFSALGTT